MHWSGKLRGPGFEPLTFELQPEVLAIFDSKGRNVASVAAVPVSADKAEQIEQSSLSDETPCSRRC